MASVEYAITVPGQDDLEFSTADHFVITDNGDLLFRTVQSYDPPKNVRAFAKGKWEEIRVYS